MTWDDNNQGDKGPWGQAPRGGNNNKRPNIPENDIDKVIKEAQERLRKIFSGGGGGGKKHFENKQMIGIIAGAIFGLWVLSGIYMVDTKEAGVVMRFGRYVHTVSPGLRYHLPMPIEKVIKLRVTDRYHTEIGYRTEETAAPSRISRRGSSTPSVDPSKEILMLTGDENIVDVSFEVQWQISDAHKFLFHVYDPQKTVRDAAESAMREVIGTTPLSEILSEGRTAAQLQTKELLQSALDFYDIGVKIEEINMRTAPPRSSISVESITSDDAGTLKNEVITTTVDEAFKDVQAAIINKEETINSAIARSNEIIPEARGNAQRLLQEAQGYKEKVIAKAEGESKRFISVYNEYKNAKDVTKRRMYLETMEDILSGMDKIILDTKGSNGVVPYLPLNELNKR